MDAAASAVPGGRAARRVLLPDYHAQRSERDKRAIDEAWLHDELEVIVATHSSFGVGIDKPNVRLWCSSPRAAACMG
jgi:hypothetical protein